MESAQVFYKIPDRFVSWPGITRIPKEDSSDMYAKITCHPQLGRATVVSVKDDLINFRLILETEVKSEANWEVSLWHELDLQTEWKEIPFQQVESTANILAVSSNQLDRQRHHFTLDLPRPTKPPTCGLRFTIKFREGPEASWKWVKDRFSVSDGLLYLQPPSFKDHDLPFFLSELDSEFEFTKEKSETPNTLLWSLTAPIEKASGQKSGLATHSLGTPANFTRWFAVCRLFNTWVLPRHGQNKFNIDKDAFLCAFLRNDGLSLVALALSGPEDVSSIFKNDTHGNVTLHSRNEAESAATCRVLVAVAESFDVANASVMYHARKLVRNAMEASGELQRQEQILKDSGFKPEWLEEWYDGFSFCTWNSLGQSLTEQKIFDAVESLAKSDINISTLIIDDNWQSLDHEGENQGVRGMTEFEANKEGFPNGLKSTVSTIRQKHPSIQHVAVWHTMMGYWGAISPDGSIAKDYKTVNAANPHGWKWTCISSEDIGRFYDDFYRFLSSCGVDGVKNDAQNMLDDLQDAPDRRSMIKSYQDAWTISTLRHLGARAISCGSQSPVIMFHSLILKSTPCILVRNSDDFFPQIDSSHAWHIFANAHNCLFSQHLNVLPDWDMFQTNHPWASYHAAARCVSGGPIYITDNPGEHDSALIKQMTAQTPRGETVVLRPRRVAKSSEAFIAYNEPKLLKIDTYCGMADTGISIVGVFNVCQFPLSELVSLSDFPGTEEGTYVIRSHVMERTTSPTKRGDSTVIHIDFDVKGYDILSAYPVRHFEARSGPVSVANLGLVGKMSGAAAIINEQIYVDDSGKLRVWTSLKALGTYGLYVTNLGNRSLEYDFMGVMFGRPIPLECVQINKKDPNVLEIDLERFWKQGGFSQTWSNEVAVEIFIR